jgi:nucleoside-diphosphate-sugar epimerase
VASEQTLSVCEIVSLVESSVGKKLPVAHCPAFPWDVKESRISAQKLHRATGWHPRHDVREAIPQLAEAKLGANAWSYPELVGGNLEDRAV